MYFRPNARPQTDPILFTPMTKFLFNATASGLHKTARFLRISYNEINILVWYFLIPFSWLCILDGILGFHFLKMGFALFTLGFAFGCRDFACFSDWLFDRSVVFLLSFRRFGMGYVLSSVLICVLVPLGIYLFLLYLLLL